MCFLGFEHGWISMWIWIWSCQDLLVAAAYVKHYHFTHIVIYQHITYDLYHVSRITCISVLGSDLSCSSQRLLIHIKSAVKAIRTLDCLCMRYTGGQIREAYGLDFDDPASLVRLPAIGILVGTTSE